MNERAAKPTVLLAGATGYIGRHVASRLAETGWHVLAVTRPGRGVGDPLLRDCERLEAEVTEPANLALALEGRTVDGVISCLASRSGVPEDAWRIEHDANLNVLLAAERSGARRFVLLSAICVQKPLLAFQHAKLAFEAQLMQSGMDWSIVRPTAFFKSLSGQLERVRAGKPFLVFGDGTLTACKPISERDLAAYLVDCLEREARHGRVLPIGGPGPELTPRAQGELLFSALGREPAFREVPPALLAGAAKVLAVPGRFLPGLAAKAELARIGHYYATESMLLWDEDARAYDAQRTPETGKDTLEAFYQRAALTGLEDQALGDHRLFGE
ncbi:MAG: NAD(P)H-binding protein [Pseudomonadota bacterium]